MGNLLRLVHDHIGLRLNLAATSEATGFPVSNLETGNRWRFWKATSTAEQVLRYDAGEGNTFSFDTVVLPRADKLAAIGANVSVQWSTDMSSWTDAYTPETPIQTADLAAPNNLDYIKEFSSLTKRGGQIRIYGSVTGVAMLAGGLFLGPRSELPLAPSVGREYGVAWPHRGREIVLSWSPMLEASMSSLLATIAAVTPTHPAEAAIETIGGAMFGARPHYLYDPLGVVFRQVGTPQLLPVICTTPAVAMSRVLIPGTEDGPFEMRWRELR